MKRNAPLGGVRQLGPNMTEVRHGDITILYLYRTPVAVFVPGEGYFATSKYHSLATSKHIGKWTGEPYRKLPKISPGELKQLAASGRELHNPRARTRSGRIRQLIHEGYPDGHGQAGAVAYREWREGKVRGNPGGPTGYHGPGKYEGELQAAEVLHHLSGLWGTEYIGGMSPEGPGWAAIPLDDFTDELLAAWEEHADEYGPLTKADIGFLRRNRYAILVEHDNGFVSAVWFTNRREWEQAVDAYERDAQEFYEEQERYEGGEED